MVGMVVATVDVMAAAMAVAMVVAMAAMVAVMPDVALMKAATRRTHRGFILPT